VVEVVGEKEFVVSDPTVEGGLELIDMMPTAFCGKIT
jgi:hypothetical protein